MHESGETTAASHSVERVSAPRSARSLFGGARMSAQRALIAQVVLALPGAFTAEELHQAVAEHADSIGLATVYRALSAMQSAGAIAAVGEQGGSALFARCGRGDHHHHLVCTSCAGVVAVDCPLGDAALAAAAREGLLVTRHDLTLYGLCAQCRTRGGEA